MLVVASVGWNNQAICTTSNSIVSSCSQVDYLSLEKKYRANCLEAEDAKSEDAIRQRLLSPATELRSMSGSSAPAALL